MAEIPFLDVRFTYATLRDELDAAYRRVMESGQYVGGAEVERFESVFAEFCGVRHAVGLANGLDALVLALLAKDIGPGDEVIVPAHTFIATWLSVSKTGATVVPVDANPLTMNIDLELLECAVTERTRAIIPVHLYGQPTHMDPVMRVAEKYDLFVLEDAAQAHGALDNGVAVGALGHAAAFSFYPGKNLGAFGDGGILVSNDAVLIEKVRTLSNYGAKRKYFHECTGVNSRLDPLQAAFLRVKLTQITKWNSQRAEIAKIYDNVLSGLPHTVLPHVLPGLEPVWHLYVIRHPRRDILIDKLTEAGIHVALHYPVANHHSDAYRDQFEANAFPVAAEICKTCLSLPIGPHLSLEQAKQVAELTVQSIREVEEGSDS